MKTIRQDAWTDEDDRVLAEIILRHIAEGSTQLAAFEESSEKLGRTSAACGYRWNANVRKSYQTGIDIAKRQRKQARNQEKKSLVDSGDFLHNIDSETASGLSWDQVFRFLKMCRQDQSSAVVQLKKLEKELAAKVNEMEILQAENSKLKDEQQRLTEKYEQVKADHRMMVTIFEKARKLTLFNPNSDQEFAHTRFRMDANGNLEKIE